MSNDVPFAVVEIDLSADDDAHWDENGFSGYPWTADRPSLRVINGGRN
jgi:hypothetical protein